MPQSVLLRGGPHIAGDEVGTGFFDTGSAVQKSKHIHTLRNPSKTDAEVIVTDIRTDGLPPDVNVEPNHVLLLPGPRPS